MDANKREKRSLGEESNELFRKVRRVVDKYINYSRMLLRACAIPIFMKMREHRILYVDPNDIVRTVSRDDRTLKGNSVWHLGTSKAGDWDLSGVPVREYWNVYTILKQRVEEKLEYEKIPEFIHILQAIENGEMWYSYRTKEAVYRSWQSFEKLYWSLKENGYKTQAELGTPKRKSYDEVRIQIGRKGDLLFEEGFHRLVIAQMLNLERIPVVVYRRHTEWAELRDAVKEIVLKRGFFHQPFNHPDLDSLPQWYGNKELKDKAFYGNERWDYILSSLPVKQGTVLDIGPYFGYFCHRFEDIGFDCYGVEKGLENYNVLKRYRDMVGKQFAVWHKDLFEVDRFDYDIVLALNVFHHIVKEKDSFNKLAKWLSRLRCKAMYFEPGESGRDAYRKFSEKEFIDFVLTNSSLNNCQLLGPTKVQRNLYLLTS